MSLPDVNPDATRVIRRLGQRLAEALVENAMLDDVVQQLQAERVAAGNTPAADRQEPAAAHHPA